MSVTIKKIAELAGVSVGTVSKVLNNQGNVKPGLRIRVEAVIEKLNYRPSAIARSFRNKQTYMIGLIIPRIMSHFYVQLVHHVERLLKLKGYTLFLGNSEEDVEVELQYLRTFANIRVDGLLIASSTSPQDQRVIKELEVFAEMGIPVVVTARKIASDRIDSVTMDYVGGAYMATKYLLEQGHTRIGMIAAPAHASVATDFQDGYLRALHDFRIAYDRDLIYFGDRNLELDYPRILTMLGGAPHPPTAILVSSNFRLVSVLKALQELGKKIPDDVSVIGFNDAEWCAYITPPLTAVVTSAERLSEIAHAMLFARIEEKLKAPPQIKKVSMELIIRDSVRAFHSRTHIRERSL